MAGEFDLVVSPRLLHELQAVLAREKFRRYLTYEEATEYVSWLHHGAEVVRDPAESVVRGAVEADPDDEYLVGLASRGPWKAATPTSCPSTVNCSTSRIGPSKTAKGAHWLIS
jgi:predicted nucleic acid-binding protein